jgi:hypothetical protein
VAKKQEPTPKPIPAQNARLDKRISDLEIQAKLVEERARYAEQEAQLRKRIADARKKIADNTPPGMLSGMLPGLGGLAGKMPKGGTRVILVLVGIVVLVIIVAKACGS